jgi:hypothetical protein
VVLKLKLAINDVYKKGAHELIFFIEKKGSDDF